MLHLCLFCSPRGNFCENATATTGIETLCPAGYVCPVGTANGRANLAPAGRYAPTGTFYASGICAAGHACPAGSTTPFGDPSGGQCPRGTWCGSGSSVPLPCSVGRFSDEPQRRMPCTPCPVGRYTSVTGASSLTQCRECEPGKTTARAGAISRSACVTVPFTCPAGQQPTKASPTSIADCGPLVCSGGLKLSLTGTSCTGCPPGFAGTPPSSCTPCDDDSGQLCPGLGAKPLVTGDRLQSELTLLLSGDSTFSGSRRRRLQSNSSSSTLALGNDAGCAAVAALLGRYRTALAGSPVTAGTAAADGNGDAIPFSSPSQIGAAEKSFAAVAAVLAAGVILCSLCAFRQPPSGHELAELRAAGLAPADGDATSKAGSLAPTAAVAGAAKGALPVLLPSLHHGSHGGHSGHSGHGANASERKRVCGVPICSACSCLAEAQPRAALVVIDQLNVNHLPAVGRAPVSQLTPFGGCCSLLGALAIALSWAVLIVQRQVAPVVIAASIDGLSARDAAAAGAGALPGVSSTGSLSGVHIALTAAGGEAGACASNVSFAASAGLAFQRVGSGGCGSVATHVFACPTCALGSIAELTVTLPWQCQSLLFEAYAVSHAGAVSIWNTSAAPSVVAAASATLAGAEATLLSTVSVELQPMLLLQTDASNGGRRTRGYQLLGGETTTTEATVAADAFTPGSASVVVTFDLAPPPIYQSITVTERVTVLQLLSSLVGMLQLFSVATFAFCMCERPLLKLFPHAGAKL